ncbi:MAG: GNAT family N-acetyltransferase [Paracoccus sp. (in: a-proteobacteria)]|uniref:GNAT family N-acetyltransferase n=1 Tax=Paracoccus sp. TaxID=267 RepID=UPI00391BC7E4
MQTLTPVPATLMPDAARLWCRHFRPPGRGQICAAQGVVALDTAGRLVGVMGLRDATGGFWQPARASGLMLLYRACPPTSDLVIDGIAALQPRRGTGRRLIAAGLSEALRRGHPGLRAELRAGNHAALAFYSSLGFCEVTRGRYGWPWGGQVIVMRLPVAMAA